MWFPASTPSRLRTEKFVHKYGDIFRFFAGLVHYLGNEAVRSAITSLQLKSGARILDIGSGLGGPARMLATWMDCDVVALELQDDLHQVAARLTERVGLTGKVLHVKGDFLKMSIEEESFDAIGSWLVFLHIDQRRTLFQKCADVLKPGGRMYVEDFVLRAEETFTDRERALLEKEVYVGDLATFNTVQKDLALAGLEVIEQRDMTRIWTDYVISRAALYQENLDRHRRVHGQHVAELLLVFYSAIQELFEGGRLSGIAYTVEKKAQA